MKEDTRQTLETFVEKANLLKSFKFDEHVRSVGQGFSANKTDDGSWVIDFSLPDQEKRDSFILSFRFFYQNNESISLANLKRFLNDPELSDEWRKGISNVLKNYYRYLNGHFTQTVNLFDGHPTRREMLDTVLYGGIAHANKPEMVRRFKLWTRDGVRENVLLQSFAVMLIEILRVIYYIGELSERELARNTPTSAGS
jgi:hypothetical protein